jgi:hypothetical protein
VRKIEIQNLSMASSEGPPTVWHGKTQASNLFSTGPKSTFWGRDSVGYLRSCTSTSSIPHYCAPLLLLYIIPITVIHRRWPGATGSVAQTLSTTHCKMPEAPMTPSVHSPVFSCVHESLRAALSKLQCHSDIDSLYYLTQVQCCSS